MVHSQLTLHEGPTQKDSYNPLLPALDFWKHNSARKKSHKKEETSISLKKSTYTECIIRGLLERLILDLSPALKGGRVMRTNQLNIILLTAYLAVSICLSP